jgi:predicted lipoprotein with Yx(FWY)xxD motif
MTRITSVFLVLAAAALVAVGCGGGGDQATAASPTTSMTSSGGSGTIKVSNAGGLGKVLADSHGRTVYLFKKDTGPASMCAGGCASEWPPVTTSGKATAGTGVSAAKLGTSKRSDGTTQVTYNGHPLYTFVGDAKAGDAAGQGLDDFGASWWAVSPAGNEVTGGGSNAGYGGGSGW